MIFGFVVLAGVYALWGHRDRGSVAASPYGAMGGKFAATFDQPSATSDPVEVSAQDLPPPDLTARPIPVPSR